MNWVLLTDMKQLEQWREASFNAPVLFFKHSTRCSISSMVLKRFEREWDNDSVQSCFLDLIAYRDLSNKLSEEYSVIHQSPQVILIKEGVCVYHNSHNAIDAQEINGFC